MVGPSPLPTVIPRESGATGHLPCSLASHGPGALGACDFTLKENAEPGSRRAVSSCSCRARVQSGQGRRLCPVPQRAGGAVTAKTPRELGLPDPSPARLCSWLLGRRPSPCSPWTLLPPDLSRRMSSSGREGCCCPQAPAPRGWPFRNTAGAKEVARGCVQTRHWKRAVSFSSSGEERWPGTGSGER